MTEEKHGTLNMLIFMFFIVAIILPTIYFIKGCKIEHQRIELEKMKIQWQIDSLGFKK